MGLITLMKTSAFEEAFSIRNDLFFVTIKLTGLYTGKNK